MASRYELTGGTKDVNPQVFSTAVASKTEHNITYSAEFPLPVQRLNNRNRAMVMEVLAIEYLCDGEGEHHWYMGISTSQPAANPTNIPNPTQGPVFHMQCVYGTEQKALPFRVYDLTDGAGHGRLIAADKIYAWVHTSAEAVHTVYCRLVYRWKNVSVTEYIGIVQSSQI